MKRSGAHRGFWAALVAVASACSPSASNAVTTVFFNGSQATNLVSSGSTADTLSSEGYLFNFTRDKLFTGGAGLTNPIGRAVRVSWPDGLEAQAVTAGPSPGGAKMVISRQDGQRFAIESFTVRLLGNTGGAGAAVEVMPLLNGEDGVPNPYPYDVTGYYGQDFAFNTPELSGFDAYKITLYVDYALMALTVVDASIPPPELGIVQTGETAFELSWSTNALDYRLESAATPAAATWNLVTNTSVIAGDLCKVQLEAAGPQRFFRLRK